MSGRESQRTSSRATSRSSVSVKALLAADAAALKAKLEFTDLETTKKAELEAKQAELEKVQTMRDLHAAEAKLHAFEKVQREEGACSSIGELDEPVSKNVLVEQYLRSLPSHVDDKASVMCPKIPLVQATTMTCPSHIETPDAHANEQVLGLTKILTDQLSISRLPPPEPGVFTGDPLKYPNWKSAFETLIEGRGIPPSEQLHYLKKYIGGAAKEAIEGYFYLTSDDAFERAKAILKKRYGDPFVVANAFRDKLDSWTKIPHRDGSALRKFADFLIQCEAAMQSIDSLTVLNDERESRKLLAKLPDWMITKWAYKVADSREQRRKYPEFSEFVKFIERESDIACDPITSIQGIRGASDNKFIRRSHGVSSLASTTDDPGNHTREMRTCLLCGKNHDLDYCKLFLSKVMAERKEFAKKRGLCFGCLHQGHMSRHCRQRLTCKTCAKSHPTSLHGDVRETTRATSGVPTEPESNQDTTSSITHLSSSCDGTRGSMTVPVWVSHRNYPERERLVYALLDTQSDTTFILQSTCEALGLEGTKVELLLSTMLSHDQKVASARINGLMARGYDSDVRITLPATYTRAIMPANRSHIPTSQMARKWPHLEKIADKLMPFTDCEVGLLIGYNCSRALAPREVIAPSDDKPYAQRTDLGWSIVGIVNPSEQPVGDCDDIGVSHKVLRVPSSQPTRNDCVANLGSQGHKNHALVLRTHVKEVINPFEVARMMELDFSDRKATEANTLSQEDRRFLATMQKEVHQQPDGHFVMPLPFRESEPPIMPNNKAQALHRLLQLKVRFRRNQRYHSDYSMFMQNIIERGYAELVQETELDDGKDGNQIWYIPHHGVYHSKKPDKIRVVFDCSAKCNGTSLNDHLLQGPDLANSLVGILCRFRREQIAVTCDVEQMFFQFKVNGEHHDYLRFLWWENGSYEAQPNTYRMKVHLFGAASSPGCANFGLKQIANDYETEFGSQAADFVRRDFYVDDGLTSVPTTDEANDLITKTKGLCAKGGLRLHKFVSNSRIVIDAVDPDDRAKGIQKLDLQLDTLPIERALGIQWCIESDSFQFRITLKDSPVTRRGILSTICSVYDPLGFTAPVLLVGKQILQSLCKCQASWDEPLPDEIRMRWERWRTDLFHLDRLKIQRCFLPSDFGIVKVIEVHHFSDASNVGYAQCSYVRLVDDRDNIHCSLVMGKCRVCPMKAVTIPRLELNAAVVSVRVSALLQRELPYPDATEVFWTDSKVVLAYINNDARRFHVFVANRVQTIRDHTQPSQWRHVKSEDNPADAGSRGLSVDELVNNSTWFDGPKFLWARTVPVTNESPVIFPDDPEVRKVQAFAANTSKDTKFEVSRLERFSTWHVAKRAVGACLKLKDRLRNRSKQKSLPLQNRAEFPYCPVTVDDLQRAEQEIIRLVQREAFFEETKVLKSLNIRNDSSERNLIRERNKTMKRTSSLYRLDPFIDANGIIRVGGRIKDAKISIKCKHPAILPRRHHVTELMIRHFHEKTAHQGRGLTTNTIRTNGFWVIGCSSAVAHYISKCVRCRKLYSKVREQKMADLPEDRLHPAPPFTYCGVDYFGPWFIKEGRKEMKRYGALFTCMASRAIHIEIANSLSTDSFINALRRFIAIRGPIRQLRSDCGTNFVGAEAELKKALAELDQTKVQTFLLEKNCDFPQFKMNVPSASHAGGVWERQIRSVRRVLGALMDRCGTQLDDESLRTFMCEAAAIINSRPLTVDNLNDPTSLEPLTPNHLLTLKSSVVLPPPGEFQRADLYSQKRWRRVQHLANEFWSQWKKEFLQNLQVRQKWSRPRAEIEVGDIVIIKDDTLPRNQWQLGRVKDVFPGNDGHVRSVKLTMSDSNLDGRGKRVHPVRHLDRPIQKLVVILGAKESRGFPVEEP